MKKKEFITPISLEKKYLIYVANHSYFSKIGLVPEAKHLVTKHFNLLNHALTIIEIAHRRAEETKRNIKLVKT